MNEITALAVTAAHREYWTAEQTDPSRRYRRRALAVRRAARRRPR